MKMGSCNHNDIRTKELEREFLGRTFRAMGSFCADCGAELWDDSLNEKFNNWVDQLDLKPKIQFKISQLAENCFFEFQKSLPNSSQATLIRAMIGLYLYLLSKPETKKYVDAAFDSKYFQSFEDAAQVKLIGAEVKTSLYRDIESWGRLFDAKPNEISSEAFHIMLSLCIAEDQKLHDFWLQEVLPELRRLLKIS